MYVDQYEGLGLPRGIGQGHRAGPALALPGVGQIL